MDFIFLTCGFFGQSPSSGLEGHARACDVACSGRAARVLCRRRRLGVIFAVAAVAARCTLRRRHTDRPRVSHATSWRDRATCGSGKRLMKLSGIGIPTTSTPNCPTAAATATAAGTRVCIYVGDLYRPRTVTLYHRTYMCSSGT